MFNLGALSVFAGGRLDAQPEEQVLEHPGGITPDLAPSHVVYPHHPADAVEIQDAGASLLVLECVPAHLATDISSKLDIPVIGIGASPGTDGQVLVLHDLLGLSAHTPRFVENFMQGRSSIREALQAFVDAVRSGDYPRDEHSFA